MGIYGTFTNIEEFNMELIPFDYDLLSMEMDSSFRVSEFKKKKNNPCILLIFLDLLGGWHSCIFVTSFTFRIKPEFQMLIFQGFPHMKY